MMPIWSHLVSINSQDCAVAASKLDAGTSRFILLPMHLGDSRCLDGSRTEYKSALFFGRDLCLGLFALINFAPNQI